MTGWERETGLRDPHFWERAWSAFHRNSCHRRQARAANPLEYWNRLAGRFGQWAKEERTQKRVDRVLTWLEQHGVMRPGMDVLDIGAGAGVFAIPFARRAKMVVALEPAAVMLDVLKERVQGEGVGNVYFLEQDWEQVEPEAAGLVGGFDLVFASLTPGIHDVETLEKMMACSRGWCFLYQFAGRRRVPAREELWRLLIGGELPPPGYDILYPFNYLYTSGYCPSLQVWMDTWEEELPVAEAISNYRDFFVEYTVMTNEVEELIRNYVLDRAVNGIFRESYRARFGAVLWMVGERDC